MAQAGFGGLVQRSSSFTHSPTNTRQGPLTSHPYPHPICPRSLPCASCLTRVNRLPRGQGLAVLVKTTWSGSRHAAATLVAVAVAVIVLAAGSSHVVESEVLFVRFMYHRLSGMSILGLAPAPLSLALLSPLQLIPSFPQEPARCASMTLGTYAFSSVLALQAMDRSPKQSGVIAGFKLLGLK
ncbi:hypothetical protein BGZ61DRAFT_443348 [Ilyonectria robusta]|uniref:uncharacterized protein n=1 Tax=Ilyonectria robusta TaxID=1079257 RepID=UPI001E8CF948|nr:uncharacterized protein BGZ61DRAFT_443348 [Ilyonectria robusta]KAH8734899.1 hypothetical protein BGZ61DRAFT_443348 [Ilyonectria robusta]